MAVTWLYTVYDFNGRITRIFNNTNKMNPISKNKIEKLEYLVKTPKAAEFITTEDIAEYLYQLTNKINKIIDKLNNS